MENQQTYGEYMLSNPKKKGRKPIDKDQKVLMVSAYLKKADKDAIISKYGSLTLAIKEEILPRLEKLANL